MANHYSNWLMAAETLKAMAEFVGLHSSVNKRNVCPPETAIRTILIIENCRLSGRELQNYAPWR